MKPRAYKRIATGRNRLFVLTMTRCSTWLGPDHLLLVDLDGYTESYRRFFFRDIKSVTIRRDNRARNIHIVLGLLLTIGIASFITVTAPEGRIFIGIADLALLGVVIAHVLKGPTCICHIQTDVQFEEIEGLRRVRKVEQVLARIREAVYADRPPLSREEIAARFAETTTAAAPPALPPPLPPPLPS